MAEYFKRALKIQNVDIKICKKNQAGQQWHKFSFSSPSSNLSGLWRLQGCKNMSHNAIWTQDGRFLSRGSCPSLLPSTADGDGICHLVSLWFGWLFHLGVLMRVINKTGTRKLFRWVMQSPWYFLFIFC